MTALELLDWMASDHAYELVRWPFQNAADYRAGARRTSFHIRLLHRHGTLTPEQRRHLHRCLRQHVATWHDRAAYYATPSPPPACPTGSP